MEDTNSNPNDQSIQLLTTFTEDDIQNIDDSNTNDTIIVINGIFGNSRGTWIVLATNTGFVVFEIRKSIRFLKQSYHNLFEVQ